MSFVKMFDKVYVNIDRIDEIVGPLKKPNDEDDKRYVIKVDFNGESSTYVYETEEEAQRVLDEIVGFREKQ